MSNVFTISNLIGGQIHKLSAILMFMFFVTVQAQGQITVSQDITSNTTWTLANSPVTITETITIASGATLTIDPGVEVRLGNAVSVLVDGGLVADGTDGNPIVFTSASATKAAGDWGTIEFRNTANVGSVINYVTMEYGSGGERAGQLFYTTGAFGVNISNSTFRFSASHGVNLRASSPAISNSEFTANQGYGIFTDLSLSYQVTGSTISNNSQGGIRVPINASPTIQDNVIESNGIGILIDNGGQPDILNNQILTNTVGIRVIEVGATKPTIVNNTISGNMDWGIEHLGTVELIARFNFWGSSSGPTVGSNTSGLGDKVTFGIVEFTPWRFGATDLPVISVTESINTDTVWETGNVYHVENSITVGANRTLTIQPGTVVKFSAGASMQVSGTLLANGAADNLIIFTSILDDAAGGDSNGDGDNSIPAPGDWNQIDITSMSQNSSLQHVIIRFAGSGSNSPAIHAQAPFQFTDVAVTNNLYEGIRVSSEQSQWTRLKINNNLRSGLAIATNSFNITDIETSYNGQHGTVIGGTNATAGAITISELVASNNAMRGLTFDRNASWNIAISSISASNFSNNGQDGVYINNNTGSLEVTGSTFDKNENHGLFLVHDGSRENLAISGNTFSGNGESGVVSTQARFIDNTFVGNRFSIGATGRLGHRYTDESGVDGNTFTDNTYNNALALYGVNLSDTLSAVFPQAIDSKSYIVAANNGPVSPDGNTVVIDPGVTVKVLSGLGISSSSNWLNFRGTLTAVGTTEEPIVFTSLRDDNYGGDINIASDTLAAAPADWSGLEVTSLGSIASRLEHVVIRYANTALTVGHPLSTGSFTQTDYEHPIRALTLEYNGTNGLNLRYGSLTLDGARIEQNGSTGVVLTGSANTTTRMVIRNAEIRENGLATTIDTNAGLLAQSQTVFTEISNSTIEGNRNGIIMQSAMLPSVIQFNQIQDNLDRGLVGYFSGVETDTVFTVTGNQINRNGTIGLLSTRAIVTDNQFEGNQFTIGVAGELSKPETVNDLGNFYEGNTFANNEYENVKAVFSTSQFGLNGKLGFSYPDAFENPVIVSISSSNDIVVAGDTLDIGPGSVLKFGRNSTVRGISSTGLLRAISEVDRKIVFTTFSDDTYGGDTNNDSTATVPARSNWGGITLTGADTEGSEFRHAILRYAGTALTVDQSAEVVVDSSFISNSATGLTSRRNGVLTVRNSDIHTNRDGITINADAGNPVIQLNNIYDNEFGLRASRNLTAINNYWGDVTGPFVDQGSDVNTEGEGNRITLSNASTVVTYRPFLGARTGIQLGDVSDNGTISAFDASLILQHVVELTELTPPQLAAADVTGDGQVSALDASFVLQFVVGNISGFPGAGKQLPVNPADWLVYDMVTQHEYTDILIGTTGALPLQAADIALNYSSALYASAEYLTGTIADDWIREFNVQESSIHLAQAGMDANADAGEVIRLRLYFHEHTRGSEANDIEITRLRFNEVSLEDYLNELISTEIEQGSLPAAFALGNNYPNPFNPSTVIPFQLAAPGDVSVTVYNTLGQQVAVLMQGQAHAAGRFEVNFDASRLSSGVYFYVVEVREAEGTTLRAVKPMTLMK